MLRKKFLKKIFLALIVMFFIFSVPIPITVDEDIREILENNNIKLPGTSFDLIDKEYEANNITKLDAVILKLTAAYSPEKLQKNYVSHREEPLPPSDDLRREIQWIINNFDELDEDSQNKLRPFILLPDDPASFFNPLNQSGEETILQKLSLVDKAYASGDAWPLYKSLLRIEPEKHLAIYITDLKTERSSLEEQLITFKMRIQMNF